MIYVLLRRNNVSKLWSTAATLPVLLDGYMIEDEHLIMAEALFTFLLMLATLMLLWRRDIKWWTALIAGLLVGYAVDVRTEGAVVLVLFPLFLLIRGWMTHGWKHLSGWLAAVRDGDRLRDPGRRVRELVPLQDRALRRLGGHGLLPVGPGLVVRRLRGDQADRQRGARLPDPAADQADPAGQLHLARAPGAHRPQQHRRPGRPGEQPAAHGLRDPRDRGAAARLREDGREEHDAVVRLPADRLPGRGHGLLLQLPPDLQDRDRRTCSRPTTTSGSRAAPRTRTG